MVWFLSIFMVKTDMSWESYDARYFCEEKVMHLWYSNNLPFSQLLVDATALPISVVLSPPPPSHMMALEKNSIRPSINRTHLLLP